MKKYKIFLISVIQILIMLFFLDLKVYAAPEIKRLEGVNRYKTSVSIAKNGWQRSEYAVLAYGVNYPDALSAVPLAAKYNAPILLTNKDSLDKDTKETLKNLQVKNVFIVGGKGVISSVVEKQLLDMKIKVTRLAGIDRYETSVKIAQQLDQYDKVVVTTGDDYGDALSVASIAGKKNIPIILVSKKNISNKVLEYIKSKNISKTYVVGSNNEISDEIIKKFNNVERIDGANKFDRNIAVINKFDDEIDCSTIYFASGNDYPDALSGAALASRSSSPVILLDTPINSITKDFINSKITSIFQIKILGGEGAVSSSILKELDKKEENKEENKIKGIRASRVISQGEWIYYIKEPEYKLYKVNKNNNEKIKLSNDEISEIIVDKNWIYYRNMSDNYNIYKISINGENKTKINDDDSCDINMVGEWIYYRSRLALYKIKKDGSNRTKVSDDIGLDLVIDRGWCYGKTLFYPNILKVKEDGSRKSEIKSDMYYHAFDINILGNQIFFHSPDYDSNNSFNTDSIYRMNIDGTEKVKLIDGSLEKVGISALKVYGDWIYYSDYSDVRKGGIFRIKTDGTQKTKISDDYTIELDLVDGWIYFTYFPDDEFDNREFYKMKIDGSERQKIE